MTTELFRSYSVWIIWPQVCGHPNNIPMCNCSNISFHKPWALKCFINASFHSILLPFSQKSSSDVWPCSQPCSNSSQMLLYGVEVRALCRSVKLFQMKLGKKLFLMDAVCNQGHFPKLLGKTSQDLAYFVRGRAKPWKTSPDQGGLQLKWQFQ